MEENCAVVDMGKRVAIGYCHGVQGSVVAARPPVARLAFGTMWSADAQLLSEGRTMPRLRLSTKVEYKGGATICFDGRVIYSTKGTGGVGTLALSWRWGKCAHIRPGFDHKPALRLLVDDEKDTAGGGVAAITPWQDGFPPRNRVVGTS